MDAVLLARIQFAFTVGFHYLFPPLTIGLAWLNFWILTKYKRTGEEFYRRMARFWIKIFALSFAIGVATGLTMEFQFGTNWSEYSRFVGDIFGAPLAAEGIFSFFLESTFLGVLLFGWNRVSTRTLWIAGLMVALGSTMSAFWILVANSWQQTPAGFQIVGGRAELTDFWAAVFNASTPPRMLHTVNAAVLTGAFFMMGVSAWFILKGRELRFARESFGMALTVACVTAWLSLGFGHYHAMQVAQTQPAKLAAVEGLFETEKPASLLLFGIPDVENERVRFPVRLPGFLSWLAYGDFETEVKGLKEFPRDEWPPMMTSFLSFHAMVGVGMAFIAFTTIGVLLRWKGALFDNRLFLRLAVLAVPLPFIINEAGWITAEVGRQPWAVYGVLRTADAVSVSVSAGEVLFSIIAFVLIYSFLFAVWLYLLRREIGHGPETAADAAH